MEVGNIQRFQVDFLSEFRKIPLNSWCLRLKRVWNLIIMLLH